MSHLPNKQPLNGCRFSSRLSTRLQLIDSCASCFWYKMGLHTYVGNPIFYYINMQSLWRGLPFAAKRSAKCSKTQCKMHQNAVRNVPKRSAKCSKTRGKMHQNARLYGANGVRKCILMHWNWSVLPWFLNEKRRVLGLKAALKSGFLLLLAWILGDENDDRRAI